MTTTAVATPVEILASEPNRRRGTKSQFYREGDRRYRLSWVIGEAPHFDETWKTYAVLNIHHYKASESRRGAHYSATLYREQERPGGLMSTTFNGTNGDTVLTMSEGAGRFNEAKFLDFVEVALTTLRHKCECEPRLLSYFDPHQEV